MRRFALIAVSLAGCYASHERVAYSDGGRETLDAGSDAHAAIDGGDPFCRLVGGDCTLIEPDVGCTIYDGQPIDLTRVCVEPTREAIACEPGMPDCVRAPRCVAQQQPDGTTRAFLVGCSWIDLDLDPSFTACPVSFDVSALPFCRR